VPVKLKNEPFVVMVVEILPLFSNKSTILTILNQSLIGNKRVKMKKTRERSNVDGYYVQILIINGEMQTFLSQKPFYIQNIGKGGFRFISDVSFELEDRVQVLLHFPDGYSQEVQGRICYNEDFDDKQTAYGFSVIEGFYSLHAAVA
jgi:hypothetical protein